MVVKCSLCPWTGTAKAQPGHMEIAHYKAWRELQRALHEIDEDIQRAKEQAGYPVDADISDGSEDDEDLSDA